VAHRDTSSPISEPAADDAAVADDAAAAVEPAAEEEEPAAEAPATDADVALADTASAEVAVPREVVTSLRVAFGYDDVAQHKADGYDVSCCVLSADGGIEGDKEEMWKFHVMATTAGIATLRAAAAAAAAAAASASTSSSAAAGDDTAAAAVGEEGAEAPADGDAVPAAPSDAGFGVEDVMWVTAPRGGEGPPAVPDGYTLLSESDLLGEGSDAETAVYLAVKRGPAPRLVTLRMYCLASPEGASPDVDAAVAACFPGREVVARAAPPAVEAAQGAPCGLLLEFVSEAAVAAAVAAAEDAAAVTAAAAPVAESPVAAAAVVVADGEMPVDASGGMDADADMAIGAGVDLEASFAAASIDDGAHPSGGDGVAASWDGSAGGHPSSSELDHELDAIDRAAASKKTKKSRKTEEDLINELEQRLLALDTEKQQLLVQNADLQRRSAALIAREKANIQIKNAASGLAAAPATGATAASEEQTAALTANDLQSAADAEAEKEKMYVDTLQKIVNARVKLERQQSEFDQLALDLQVHTWCSGSL